MTTPTHSQERLVLEEQHGAIRYLTLNRPSVLNALSRALDSQLSAALDDADRDPTVRVVVLKGEGRAFSAGADLKERADSGTVDVSETIRLFRDRFCFLKIWNLSKPVIAAIHGYALGGAFQLAGLCDITVATQDSKLGEPEIRFANPLLVPITPAMIPMKQARSLLYFGEPLSGADAARLGIVTRVSEPDAFDRTVQGLAVQLSRVPAPALRQAKRSWNYAVEAMGLRRGAMINAEILALTMAEQSSSQAAVTFLRNVRDRGAGVAVAETGQRIIGGEGEDMSAEHSSLAGPEATGSAEPDLVISEVSGGVARITFNRPAVLNAFNPPLLAAFDSAFDAVLASPAVKVIVLAGAGRAFSAGMDLKEPLAPRSLDEGIRPNLGALLKRCLRIWDSEKPIVAAVHGYCLGHACDIAAICDLTVAAESAKFGVPEIRHVGGVATLIYPYVMPMKRGRNFLYLGETLDARDAEEAGLVNSVVPDDRLIEEALRLADRLCQIPTVALRQMKRAISRSYELMGMRESLEYNLETLASVLNNQPIEDLVARQRLIERDGLKSFLQSRDGSFQ